LCAIVAALGLRPNLDLGGHNLSQTNHYKPTFAKVGFFYAHGTGELFERDKQFAIFLLLKVRLGEDF
jgi:hypothetical protein